MKNFDKEAIRKELKEIITPDTVFVCVGTNKALFDIFGPLCGDYLKRKNIPYFGDCEYNVNALTMYDRLKQIEKLKINNKNIIAIDAAVTEDENKVDTVVVKRNRGIYPGAGVGKKFPEIGKNSIMMFTLSRKDLKPTMEGYRNGKGMMNDRCNIKRIRRYAKELVNVIDEVYQEVRVTQALI
jgi:putative sporulation protein YyaC